MTVVIYMNVLCIYELLDLVDDNVHVTNTDFVACPTDV